MCFVCVRACVCACAASGAVILRARSKRCAEDIIGMRWKQPPFVQCSRSGLPDNGPTLAHRLNRRRLECRISSASKLRPLLKFIERLIRRRAIARVGRRRRSQCLDRRQVHCHHLDLVQELLEPRRIRHLEVLRRERHPCDMCKITRMSQPSYGMRVRSPASLRYSKLSLSTGRWFLPRLLEQRT